MRRWATTISAIVFAALVPQIGRAQQVPASAPAVDPALARQRVNDQRDAMRGVQDYPSLGTMSLANVVQFRIENNNLSLYTKVQPTRGTSRVDVTDLPGICTLDIHAFAQAKPPVDKLYTPFALTFMRHQFDDPGFSESLTTVLLSPMSLQIDLDQESLTETRSVSIVESPIQMNRGDEPAVILRVRIMPKTTGDMQPVIITRSAADFVSLRRQFPADTARYLEPIFRSLHADAVVFDADPRVAWQVFEAEATPDPAMVQRVRTILSQMDADDFRTRQAAAAQLKQLGQSGAIVLEHMNRSAFSAEQSSGVEAFLSSYHPVSDEQAARLKGDVNFLMDCLLDENDPFIVNQALGRLRELTGQKVAFDQSLRGAARQTAVYDLRQTLTASPATTQPAK